jgi:hypothetical protein
MRARISVAADQRKARERFDHYVRGAQIALSQVLPSTKPRDGQGFEGQRVARTGDAQVGSSTFGFLGCFFFSRAIAGRMLDRASDHGKQ